MNKTFTLTIPPFVAEIVEQFVPYVEKGIGAANTFIETNMKDGRVQTCAISALTVTALYAAFQTVCACQKAAKACAWATVTAGLAVSLHLVIQNANLQIKN